MREVINTCDRSNDLVAYLYHEATPAEVTDFETHLHRCAQCGAEVEAFGLVRESIGEWRSEALGVAFPALGVNPTHRAAQATGHIEPKRSALAALREFFSLSPAWMRAATAALTLVFCALAVIAVAYFAQQPKVVVMEKPGASNPKNASELPVNSITPESAPTSPIVIATEKRAVQSPKLRRPAVVTQVAKKRRQVTPLRLSEPTTEVAAANDYLPFTVPTSEDKLPSLVDLADEPN